ncbi:MAG TPA: DUF6770 family protein, partial [Bacteroidia bacterium]|nr:DUF6770 family protein [Bacteroidia bacterium]
HKVIQTADGKLFAVGEQYRKAVSGVGVAAGVLMGGHSNVALMKIDLHDMLTFEFNKSLQITDVYVFEKKKTAIELPRGIGMNDANKLGYLIKLYHWFDYAFTSVSSDRKTFYCSYVNYEKDKEEGSEYTIGNISYTKDQKLVNDKIKLKSNPTTFFVLPGKPGYVAIFEYFRKQKKATIRLEKLNL